MNQITQFAMMKSVRYFQKQVSPAESSQIKVFNVFKIVHMPEKILVALFKTMGEQKAKYYRALCLEIHPDKNRHEQAEEAF